MEDSREKDLEQEEYKQKPPFETLVEAGLVIEKLRVQSEVRQTHLVNNGLKSLVEAGRISEEAARQIREEWEKSRRVPDFSTAFKKSDLCDPETDELHTRIQLLEDYVDGRVADLISAHPAFPWFSKVKGIGRENIAKLIGLVDIEEDDTASSLWKFAGYAPDPDTNKTMKRTPGEKLPYNSQLRSMCWRLGNSLIRANGKYYAFYIQEKKRLVGRFQAEGKQVVPTSKLPKDANGKVHEPEDMISEGHVHNWAKRLMLKLFLAHLWLVWRQAKGLPVRPSYAAEKLNHKGIIDPWDMVDK